MPVERELKFRVSAHNLDAVASWHIPGGKLGERSDSDLLSTYFDTAKRKLRRHGLTLRVRQNGRTHIQTAANGKRRSQATRPTSARPTARRSSNSAQRSCAAS
jgi:inorganic triphosphatase YgiF